MTRFALCALLVCGCTPRSKAADETTLLVAAVDRVRAAPNENKAATVPTLEAVPCTVDAVCATKRLCVEFAKRTVDGIALKTEVEKSLADVKAGKLAPDSEAAQSLYGKLDESAKALKEGEAALLKCDQELQRLKRGGERP
jgi:hypothetical protein